MVKLYVDASFSINPDFKSRAVAITTMGNGLMQSVSREQKINTRSNTKSELVAVEYASVYILWTVLFIEWKGYNIDKNILYQNNKSAILLEVNGNMSVGKRTRALNICYFYDVSS